MSTPARIPPPRRGVVSLWATALLALPLGAAAAEPVEDGELVPIEEQLQRLADLEVIQNRKYQMTHEATLRLGTLPIDPYYKGYTLNGSYTWHIFDWLAWEIADFTYSFNAPTKLQDEVRRIALGQPDVPLSFPAIEWMVASRAHFKPLYGKEAVFNTDVIHLEAYLSAGGELLFVYGVPGRRGIGRDRFAPGLDLGGGLRVHLDHNWSLRFDINEIIYFVPTGVATALHIRIGTSFNFWFEE